MDLSKRNYNTLQTAHKKALRNVGKGSRLAHTSPICLDHNMYKLTDKINILLLKKIIRNLDQYNEGKDQMDETLVFNQTRTRRKLHLKLHRPDKAIGIRYTNLFEKYNDIITSNLKEFTKIYQIKQSLRKNYEKPCLMENCFACNTSSGTNKN